MEARPSHRVMRVISRLNVGGPARHVVILDDGLREHGFETLLVHGTVGAGEASFEHLTSQCGVPSHRIPPLGRRLHPLDDLRAVIGIWKVMRDFQPDIVHTHTAKAGALGRLAAALHNALVPRERRIAIVHTFHGHVLHGYFGRVGSLLVRVAERLLSSVTDCTIAISELQRRDLVERFSVAPTSRTIVVPLGLQLASLLALTSDDRARARVAAGYDREFVVGFVGRLVPIKNVGLLIDAVALARAELPDLRLLIVGDGPERSRLESHARSAGVADIVAFKGWQEDLAAAYASMAVLVVPSKNEGTPVALIEAMAAGVPVIATAVGGVPDVVSDAVTGLLSEQSPRSIAEAILETAQHGEAAAERAARARERVRENYCDAVLVDRVAHLYQDLVARKTIGFERASR